MFAVITGVKKKQEEEGIKRKRVPLKEDERPDSQQEELVEAKDLGDRRLTRGMQTRQTRSSMLLDADGDHHQSKGKVETNPTRQPLGPIDMNAL